ncbi:SIR2 family protein [Bradyrhizobium sp. 139]|uniref:SIR2 family NAD-dependent protein deacylase n=1 Tax=Bradyrhizobium sp. 139 TaxID=2782616 RepID=UPI001FF9CBF6|nr:SIR2 family protein [Bradyrhizobium sp. 139]MCK1741192.1 SIR2 family protein [Bradyrhizobium sp. 139]
MTLRGARPDRLDISDADIPKELVAAVRQRSAVLFVGAGPSISVGLPSWQSLIDHLTKELSLDPSDLASSPASHYSLAEYYRIVHGSIGPLRSWMDRNWKVSEDRVCRSKMHELIVSLDFPIIYTTNFDRNIEAAFAAHGRDFIKVANARDIAKIRERVTQIVKFHGDFDDDDSLVVTETDYFNRLAFDSPLDVKFRADALGKTVLFIGYSMRDLNIRLLLHNLWRTWHNSGHEQDRPHSFVFMSEPEPVQEAVLSGWGIKVLSSRHGTPDKSLTDFLQRLLDAAGRQDHTQAEAGNRG